MKGALAGKFAGVFVSTGTPGGGQEATVISSLSTLMHHGMCFVPLGYSRTFSILANLDEVRGGTLVMVLIRTISSHVHDRFALGRGHVCWR